MAVKKALMFTCRIKIYGKEADFRITTKDGEEDLGFCTCFQLQCMHIKVCEWLLGNLHLTMFPHCRRSLVLSIYDHSLMKQQTADLLLMFRSVAVICAVNERIFSVYDKDKE